MNNYILFDAWFSSNYNDLKRRCVPTNLFGEIYNVTNEDVFHDAYLVARNNAKNEDEEVFLQIFLATYKRQCKIRYNAELKEVRPKDLFWSFLRVDEELNLLEEETKKIKREKLSDQIRNYAKKYFSNEDFQIFKMYFINSFTLENVAVALGRSTAYIWGRVHYTQFALCSKFETI